MNLFQRRRYKKLVHHVLQEARHARHMREDVASPEDLAALRAAEQGIGVAWHARDAEAIDRAVQTLEDPLMRVRPPRNKPRLRENVEIIAVAVAVAMGFRTYFIQPFKIPTGSMMPTLYGITVKEQNKPLWFDRLPFKLIPWALTGEHYVEVRAKTSGLVDSRVDASEDRIRVYIAGVPHDMPRDLPLRVRPGMSRVAKGDILGTGRLRHGDHIFVNKLKYYVMPPARGDIFVFSTSGISYPRIRPDSFYIKRLAGMPGERIQIQPPYLVADGKRVLEPYPFKRLVQDVAGGYRGYQLPRYDPSTPAAIRSENSVLQLGEGEYLPLGDNTGSSLDGRYFGAVKRDRVIGPAFMVYWPFGSRWGIVR